MVLKTQYKDGIEIGIDEAGRGPLFGRVYAAAVIIDDRFDCTQVKDSKKYTSKKKISMAYDYIIKNSLAYGIGYADQLVIDKINIRQATFSAMHQAIGQVCNKIKKTDKLYLLVDGNDFKPYLTLVDEMYTTLPYYTIKGGDNTYASIAAASILAKVSRDKYIDRLCQQFPKLIEYYEIDKNKGYGTKKHIDGIKKHGITVFHRETYNICKNMSKIDL